MFNSSSLIALVALLHAGAIFGFFFAWVCSTIWGLDQLAPNTAIAAMQAMNASVRNAVFAPAFFGTGPLLALAALLTWTTSRPAGLWLLAGAVIYIFGGMVLTIVVHIPLNEELATVSLPLPDQDASRIWSEYSQVWHFWNSVRTVFSGLALACAALGFANLFRVA